jgi:hypothetical protein
VPQKKKCILTRYPGTLKFEKHCYKRGKGNLGELQEYKRFFFTEAGQIKTNSCMETFSKSNLRSLTAINSKENL